MLEDFKVENLLDLPQGGDVVEAQHERYRLDVKGHELWCQMATQCVNLLEGTQWTEDELATMKNERRPYLTKNKIAPLHRLMMGFLEENDYEIKFMPGNDGTGTQQIADTLSAVSKQIEESNDSE